jgi:hypothetical protein
MLSSLLLSAPNDHAWTKTNYTSCIPSPPVTNVRNFLESLENRARREKRNGNRSSYPLRCEPVVNGLQARRSHHPTMVQQERMFPATLGVLTATPTCMSLHQLDFPRPRGVVEPQLDRTLETQGSVMVHALWEVS